MGSTGKSARVTVRGTPIFSAKFSTIGIKFIEMQSESISSSNQLFQEK